MTNSNVIPARLARFTLRSVIITVTVAAILLGYFGALDRADRTPREITGTFLRKDGTGIKDVVLIATNDSLLLPPVAAHELHISVSEKGFDPRVVLLRPGDTLTVTNLSQFANNVIIGFHRNQSVNHTLPGGGSTSVTVTAAEPNATRLSNAIHPGEPAYIFVVDSHATKSNTNGEWSLTDILPGQYHLRIWHPDVGFLGTADLQNNLIGYSLKNYHLRVPRFRRTIGDACLPHVKLNP